MCIYRVGNLKCWKHNTQICWNHNIQISPANETKHPNLSCKWHDLKKNDYVAFWWIPGFANRRATDLVLPSLVNGNGCDLGFSTQTKQLISNSNSTEGRKVTKILGLIICFPLCRQPSISREVHNTYHWEITIEIFIQNVMCSLKTYVPWVFLLKWFHL